MQLILLLVTVVMVLIAAAASGRIFDIDYASQGDGSMSKQSLGCLFFGAFFVFSLWSLYSALHDGSIKCPSKGCLTIYDRSASPGAYWAIFTLVALAGTYCLSLAIAMARIIFRRIRA
jgi:hypothetical protein